MTQRQLTGIDRFVSAIDQTLRGFGEHSVTAARPYPAEAVADEALDDDEKRHSAGLMRVNHAGEVAAQGLYQGHALFARDPDIGEQIDEAAREEIDHMAWCEQRLHELDAMPSKLQPLWFSGAYAFGALSGLFGDRWSLGFIEETERQVSEHLGHHLEGLPDNDHRSRAVVSTMRADEERHGANAHAAGAATLPEPVPALMRGVAGIMKRVAYRL